jgi:hypothetical protein
MATSETATRLSKDTAALVREELESVRGELGETIKHMGGGAVLAGAAAGCGLLALVATHEAILRLLEEALPPPAAGAVLAAGYVAAAVALVLLAKKQLKAAADAAAEHTANDGADEPAD